MAGRGRGGRWEVGGGEVGGTVCRVEGPGPSPPGDKYLFPSGLVNRKLPPNCQNLPLKVRRSFLGFGPARSRMELALDPGRCTAPSRPRSELVKPRGTCQAMLKLAGAPE